MQLLAHSAKTVRDWVRIQPSSTSPPGLVLLIPRHLLPTTAQEVAWKKAGVEAEQAAGLQAGRLQGALSLAETSSAQHLGVLSC